MLIPTFPEYTDNDHIERQDQLTWARDYYNAHW